MKTFKYKEGQMTKEELSKFLPDHPSIATIKKWTFEKKIPFHKSGPHKNSQLWFIESEISLWQELGRPTIEEFNKLK